MVSSTVPRFDDRCPPVLLTLCSTNSRSSRATCGSSARDRRRRSAGKLIDSSNDFMCLLLGSVLAIDHQIGQQTQARSVPQAAAGQRVLCTFSQRLSLGYSTLEPEHRHVGGL